MPQLRNEIRIFQIIFILHYVCEENRVTNVTFLSTKCDSSYKIFSHRRIIVQGVSAHS